METKWSISESGGDVVPGSPGLNDTRVGTPILLPQPSIANVWAIVQVSFLMYKLRLTVYFDKQSSLEISYILGQQFFAWENLKRF